MPGRAAILGLVGLAVVGAAVGVWLALPSPPPRPISGPLSTWDPADPDLGRKAYVMCQACHGIDGAGVPGYAPALVGSPWLAGDPLAGVLITLHGYDATGEPGAAYVSSRMLGHGHQLADHEVAGLLSWLRARWGQGEAVSVAEVTAIRARFHRRDQPWSPAELRTLTR